MENKKKICSLLLPALRKTREAGDITALTYDSGKEIVTVEFKDGGKRRINVAMDSGTAMILDIMNGLGC